MPTDHPSDDTIRAYLAGRLDPQASGPVEQHLAGCPQCAGRLDELAAGDRFEGKLRDAQRTINYRPAGAVAGDRFGPYKLIERVGEGGMGEVWVAEQSEPVRRKVAVKLVKPGMDSRAVLARFEAERQALALMDHPNIAKVHDAGATPDGCPYFVMELVKGVPITQFCDERKLTPRQRLELFVPVCQAIQHAHQKGVIHRDIKPSNVLVALYDDRPVPKVIDFGIAKATGQSLTDKSVYTAFGAVVGTPEYMSPEQAGFNNLDVDTRSDVYSLGVLLYELLTGSPPFGRQELARAGLVEILRVIREEEPPRPSQKLSTAEGLPSLAAARGTEPRRLTGLMRGELDWVVMRALEKDRERRYGTANGLALDIQRYLADEVVEARPPSLGYRLRKFVRRHKGQVIAASLVLFALLVGIAGATWGLIEAKKQKADAEEARGRAEAGEKLAGERLVQVEAEKKKAEEESRIAQAVREFLQDKLLLQGEPSFQASAILKAGGSSSDATLNPTIRELLDRAAKELAEDRIDKSFPNLPRVQAEILRTVGGVYSQVGEPKKAIELLKRSESLARQHLGPSHQATLLGRNNLAIAYQNAGQLDLAVSIFQQVVEAQKAALGQTHPNTLSSMGNLASAYLAAGKVKLALPLAEEALARKKAAPTPDNAGIVRVMRTLVSCYLGIGNVEKALTLSGEALDFAKAGLGPDHPGTMSCVESRALAYLHARKFDLARPLCEELVRYRKARLGPDHPNTLMSMHNLAGAYMELGQFDLAVPLFEETLRLRKALRGPDHPHTLLTMANLAHCYELAGQSSLALPLYEAAWESRKAKLGADHPNTLISMLNLAVAYREGGKLHLALPLSERTFELMKNKHGPDHPNTLTSMGHLSRAFAATGNVEKAEALARERLQLARRKWPANSPTVAIALESLGEILLRRKKWADAEPPLRECLTVREKTQPEDWRTFFTRSMLGGALLGQRKFTEAEPLLRAGYEGLKQRDAAVPIPDRPKLAAALDRLIELSTTTNKPDEVKTWRAERAKYAPAKAPKPPGKK